MKATHSSLVFVDRDGAIPCPCKCPGGSQEVFRTVWDRLCRQLFEAMPVGMDPGDQLPDIDIWKDGVFLVDDSYPYTFIVASDGENVPKRNDVIEYKGKFYVIGGVQI